MVISRMKCLNEPALIICLQMTHTHFHCCLLLPTCLIIRILIHRGEWDLKAFPCTRWLRFTTLSLCKVWGQVSSLMTVLQGSQNTSLGLEISHNSLIILPLLLPEKFSTFNLLSLHFSVTSAGTYFSKYSLTELST